MRRGIAAIVALAFALLLPHGPMSHAQAQSLTTVRLGMAPVDVVTPLLYAQESGLYRKDGLDVQIVKLTNGPGIAAAVAGGSLEFAQAATLSVVQAYAKGLPFTIIGSLARYNADRPDDALMVPIDSEIRRPQDLRGKTLATVSLQGMPALGTYAWLDALRIGRESIKYVEMPPAATITALEQHQVEGAVFYEPFYSAYLATGKARVLAYPYDAVAKHFSNAVLFANTDWVRTHPDVVARFLRASEEASEYVAAHEDESVHLIADFAGLKLSAAQDIHHEGRGVTIGADDVQPLIDAAAKQKFIPRAFPAHAIICSCALRK